MSEQPETTDMNELFNRDALELTDENIDSIIQHMRNRRHLFATASDTQTHPCLLYTSDAADE